MADNTPAEVKVTEVATIPQERTEMGVGSTDIPVKVDKRKLICGLRPMTVLSNESISNLIQDLASNIPIGKLVKKYKIGQNRIKDIRNREFKEIDKIRAERAAEKEKVFLQETILKRHEILENITEMDILKASLHAKTGAIVDLTNVKRLESGQSTENVAIIGVQTSDEQLREYIVTGIMGAGTEGK